MAKNGVDHQPLKKRCVATEVLEKVRENDRMELQGFESADMWYDQRKRIVEIAFVASFAFTEDDSQRRRLRALEVGPGFFGIPEVQRGP